MYCPHPLAGPNGPAVCSDLFCPRLSLITPASLLSYRSHTLQTEKYVMSDAEYSKRENSFRKFKQQQKEQQQQQQQQGAPADDAQAQDGCGGVACTNEREAELHAAVGCAGRCIAEPGARKGVVR